MMIWKEKLQPNSYLRKLFDSLPCNMFIDLSHLSSFNIRHLTTLYMLRPTLSNLDITFKQIGDLPFSQLELILCGNVAMGYLLTSQKYKYKIGRNFVLISRSEHQEAVERLFIDNNFIVLGNDSRIVATVKPHYWI
jgi:hypothetical protein